MTDADVTRIVEDAALRGITIDDYDAKVFLGAKEMLVADAKNQNARDTVAAYTRLLTVGERPASFSVFLLPVFYTDEENAAREKMRRAHLAATGEVDA
jgi:hypothetical protein